MNAAHPKKCTNATQMNKTTSTTDAPDVTAGEVRSPHRGGPVGHYLVAAIS